MKKDYEKIEEELEKKREKKRGKIRVSGKSVFDLKKIIERKGKKK